MVAVDGVVAVAPCARAVMRMNIFDIAPLPYRSPPQFITPRHFGEPQWHAIFFASTWNL